MDEKKKKKGTLFEKGIRRVRPSNFDAQMNVNKNSDGLVNL